ncbi:MAG: helix-turn-helix domain-containing protein [Parvularcula sp.]|jgi:hypothetical protein|nr:helix-turn-helix domain-containing protein [Parvularcula sp.]
MIYSAGQAAKAVGMSTATITRAIKRGRISASKDETGSWRIDPAELHRVFPSVATQGAVEDPVQGYETPIQDGDLRLEVALLEERLRAAEALKAMADELRAAAERDRDAWRAQAERLTKALPAPAIETARSGRRRWWQPWR